MANKRYLEENMTEEELASRKLYERSTKLYARIPFDHENRVKITIRYEDESEENVRVVVQGAYKKMFNEALPENFIK
jgi:hypothetical protein